MGNGALPHGPSDRAHPRLYPTRRSDKWDENKLRAYPAGTFYSKPARAPQFTWAKDGEVIIQVTGLGPSRKTYIKQE
jgi:hypothetical protein